MYSISPFWGSSYISVPFPPIVTAVESYRLWACCSLVLYDASPPATMTNTTQVLTLTIFSLSYHCLIASINRVSYLHSRLFNPPAFPPTNNSTRSQVLSFLDNSSFFLALFNIVFSLVYISPTPQRINISSHCHHLSRLFSSMSLLNNSLVKPHLIFVSFGVPQLSLSIGRLFGLHRFHFFLPHTLALRHPLFFIIILMSPLSFLISSMSCLHSMMQRRQWSASQKCLRLGRMVIHLDVTFHQKTAQKPATEQRKDAQVGGTKWGAVKLSAQKGPIMSVSLNLIQSRVQKMK